MFQSFFSYLIAYFTLIIEYFKYKKKQRTIVYRKQSEIPFYFILNLYNNGTI